MTSEPKNGVHFTADSSVNTIHILHVDDDPKILEISKLMLCEFDAGFEVDHASSVDEAFSRISLKKYDVVVSDFEMPSKTGLDFLAELKEKRFNLPFILFTGKGREEIATKALNLGADGYYNKQGNPETVYGELVHGIKRVVTWKQAEEKAKQLNYHYAQLFTTIPDGVVIYEAVNDGEDFIFKAFNPTAEKIEKVSKDQVLDKKVTEVFPGVKEFGLFKVLQKVWKTGQPEYLADAFYKDQKDLGSWRENWVYKLPSNEIVAIYKDITESKRAQIELENKYESLERVARSIDSGLAIIGKDYRVVWANQVLIKAGFKPNQKCYQTVNRNNVCPDCGVQKIFEEKTSLDVHEYKTTDSKGKIKFIELRATPIMNKNGEIVGAIELAIPITERKKAEEEILRSKQQYKLLFDNNLDGLIIAKRDGRILAANPAICKMLGMSLQEVLAAGRQGIVIDDEQRNVGALRELDRVGKVKAEVNFKRKDGSIIEAEITSTNFQDIDGSTSILVAVRDITERKENEDNLRLKQCKLSTVLDSSPTIIFYKDVDGKFIEVNRAFSDAVSISKEMLLGKTVFDLYSKNVAQAMANDDFEVFKTKRSKTGIVEPYESSTGLRWIRTDKIPTFDEKGVLNGLVGFSEDITERKKAEDALVESEEKFRLLHESAGVGVGYYSLDGKIIFYNKIALSTIKMGEWQVVGKSLKELFQREQADIWLRRFKSIAEMNKTQEYEDEVELPIGKRWFRSTYSPVTKGRAILGIQVISADITDQKKVEEMLRESEARFKAIASSTPDLLLVQDKELRYTMVLNPQLGLTEKQMMGKTDYDILPKEDADRLTLAKRQALETGKTVVVEIPLISKKGEQEFFDGYYMPKYNANGKVDGLIGYFRNVTRQKMAEKNSEILTEKLRVTGSLTRHDVGNKLMAAKTNLYLLRKMVSGSDLVRYIDSIELSLDKSEEIFEFARDYEKTGNETLCEINVEQAFNEAIRLMPNLTVEIVNKVKGLSVFADSLLGHLFYNLIDNSIKHGKRVSQITLRYEETDKNKQIIYEDDGVGIPLENKAKIFAGFTTGGTGLGLKLVKRIVNAYGWAITEEGIPDKGAKYVITIPKSKNSLKWKLEYS
jgi:PAS domain S-box-containing protein